MKVHKVREIKIKEVTAPTIIEAVEHLDEMHKSYFDMYVIHALPSEDREGYVTLKICSWENFSTREHLSC